MAVGNNAAGDGPAERVTAGGITIDTGNAPDKGRRRQESGVPAWVGRSKPAIKWAIIAIVLLFLYLTIRRAYNDVQQHREHLDFANMNWAWLAAGILMYGIGMVPAGIAWLQTLKSFQQVVPFWYGIYVYFLGHLGKYVPGKAMVIVLRAGKLHAKGVELKPSVVSVFVETITSVCTGAILGCTLLLCQRPLPPAWIVVGAIACIPCSLILLLPHTFRMVLAFLAKSKIGRMPKSVSEAFTGWMMLRTCLWMLLGWSMHGTAAWMVLAGIQSTSEIWSWSAWSACVAAVSLGAVVGFASMLPSGAVVRELVITWLLSQVVSQPIALFAAVAFRIASLIAESVVIGILSLFQGSFSFTSRKP